MYHHEDVVSAYVCRLLWSIVHVGVDSVGWEDNGHDPCCGLHRPLAMVDLVHVPLFGLHQDVNVSLYALCGKAQPPLEVPRFDDFDQCGYDGVVQARIIEVHELVHGGAFVEAVDIHGGWGS